LDNNAAKISLRLKVLKYFFRLFIHYVSIPSYLGDLNPIRDAKSDEGGVGVPEH